MKLTITERLELLELLPREESYAGLKELRKAKECIALGAEEIKEYKYEEIPAPSGHGMQIRWNPAMDLEERDVPINEYATGVIVNLLSKEEKEKKLKERHMPLYEKFVIGS